MTESIAKVNFWRKNKGVTIPSQKLRVDGNGNLRFMVSIGSLPTPNEFYGLYSSGSLVKGFIINFPNSDIEIEKVDISGFVNSEKIANIYLSYEISIEKDSFDVRFLQFRVSNAYNEDEVIFLQSFGRHEALYFTTEKI